MSLYINENKATEKTTEDVDLGCRSDENQEVKENKIVEKEQKATVATRTQEERDVANAQRKAKRDAQQKERESKRYETMQRSKEKNVEDLNKTSTGLSTGAAAVGAVGTCCKAIPVVGGAISGVCQVVQLGLNAGATATSAAASEEAEDAAGCAEKSAKAAGQAAEMGKQVQGMVNNNKPTQEGVTTVETAGTNSGNVSTPQTSSDSQAVVAAVSPAAQSIQTQTTTSSAPVSTAAPVATT